MLDRTKLAKKIDQLSNNLFHDISHELELARTVWERIAPQQGLDVAYSVAGITTPHRVLSVDGSQVYPDRHQGTSCFLVNIGSIMLNYGCPGERVRCTSEPTVFSGKQFTADFDGSVELVDCVRQELELVGGLQCSSALQEQQASDPLILLFDGSLIFWHLENRGPEVKHTFAQKYCATLQQLYEQNTLMASYISLPKSKDLVKLIRAELTSPARPEPVEGFEHLVDTDIAGLFLDLFERSKVFESKAAICALYPEHLRPHFFYMHVGTEIARVEIPAWLAADETKVDVVARVMRDQCVKGGGYPVSLAEAHEQAVIKTIDREFFYYLVAKLGVQQKQQTQISRKLLRKKRIGI